MSALQTLTLAYGPGEIESTLPLVMVSGTGATDPRPRLLVEANRTSFYEGREFRYQLEFNLAAGTDVLIRATVPGDIIVHQREITIVEGKSRITTEVAGTSGGTWTPATAGRQNSMASQPQPMYTPTVTIHTGGTLTSSVVVDVKLLETSVSQTQMVIATQPTVALGAGTVYVRILNTGAQGLRGTYTIVWEEVQPQSARLY